MSVFSEFFSPKSPDTTGLNTRRTSFSSGFQFEDSQLSSLPSSHTMQSLRRGSSTSSVNSGRIPVSTVWGITVMVPQAEGVAANTSNVSSVVGAAPSRRRISETTFLPGSNEAQFAAARRRVSMELNNASLISTSDRFDVDDGELSTISVPAVNAQQPTLIPLAITSTMPTKGLANYFGHMHSNSDTCVTLCPAYHDSGFCDKGKECMQIHADRDVVRQTLEQPPDACCAYCGDIFTRSIVRHGELDSMGQIGLSLEVHGRNEGRPTKETFIFPLERICLTTLIARLPVQNNLRVAQQHQLCRSHSEGQRCKWGKECAYLHVCRRKLAFIREKLCSTQALTPPTTSLSRTGSKNILRPVSSFSESNTEGNLSPNSLGSTQSGGTVVQLQQPQQQQQQQQQLQFLQQQQQQQQPTQQLVSRLSQNAQMVAPMQQLVGAQPVFYQQPFTAAQQPQQLVSFITDAQHHPHQLIGQPQFVYLPAAAMQPSQFVMSIPPQQQQQPNAMAQQFRQSQ